MEYEDRRGQRMTEKTAEQRMEHYKSFQGKCSETRSRNTSKSKISARLHLQNVLWHAQVDCAFQKHQQNHASENWYKIKRSHQQLPKQQKPSDKWTHNVIEIADRKNSPQKYSE